MPVVDLHHSTTEENARSIMREGFAVSHVSDSQGCTWFSSPRDHAFRANIGCWWIIVSIPDAVAERYRGRLPDGTQYLDNFKVPWDVVNSYRATFRVESPDDAH